MERDSASTDAPIRHIGYYHYGDHSVPPLDGLRAALTLYPHKERYEDALIVLPEAINAGTNDQYFTDPILSGPSIFDEIRSLHPGIAFVAGLTVRNEMDGELPFSSAYVIAPDPNEDHILAHKRGRDCADGVTYRPYDGPPTDPIVVRFRNLGLAALICMDAYLDERTEETHQQLDAKLNSLADVECRIICVPARSTGWMRFMLPTNAFVVFANATRRVSSFVQGLDGNDIIRVPNDQQRTNQVMLMPLP